MNICYTFFDAASLGRWGDLRSGHILIAAQIFAAKLFQSIFDERESLSQNET